MIYRKPYYFDDFKCIADKCPDTCCSGWQIVIDEESLQRYEEQITSEKKSDFSAFLYNSIDFEEGCYRQKNNRRCYMLRDDNLCQQVLELGEDSLCDTCHLYPRHVEEFEGVREWSLSISCPEAARIVLENVDGLVICENEDSEIDPLEAEFEDFDIFLYTQLEAARPFFLDCIKDRKQSFDGLCNRLLKCAALMQEALEQNNIGDIENIAKKCSDMEIITGSNVLGTLIDKDNALIRSCQFLMGLERLNDSWDEYLLRLQKFSELDIDKQTNVKSEFYKTLDFEKWETFRRNLLEALIYTWFLGAVYDDEIYSKVALSVFCCEIIFNIIVSSTENNVAVSVWIDVARRFMREVEHSEENLISLEEWIIEKK